MSIKDQVILIIDDDPEIVKLLTKIFEVLGAVIISAHNLTEAKLLLEQQVPHLIFLDIKLENENGLEFILFLRTLSFGSNIPVIIFSGIEDKKVQNYALTIGAVDYIQKPIVANQIIQKARKYLKDGLSRPRATNKFYVFPNFQANPQILKVEGQITQLNQLFMEVESNVKIGASSCVLMEAPLCEKINFINAKFNSGDSFKAVNLGHYVNKLYYLGASDSILQNIKRGKII